MIGSFLTGIFTDQAISALDGSSLYPGGWNGDGAQVGRQFAEIGAISAYSFVVSCIPLLILKYIPGVHLRVSEDAEMMGLDLDQFFDEQIREADWELFTKEGHVTHEIPTHARSGEGVISNETSMEREAIQAESKEV